VHLDELLCLSGFPGFFHHIKKGGDSMIKRKKHQCTQFPVRVSEKFKVKLPVTSSVVILFGQLFGIQRDLANQRGSYAIPEKSLLYKIVL